MPRFLDQRSEKILSDCLFQDFADSIYQMVAQKFQELTDNFTSMHARHKTLAGIVMTKGKISSYLFSSGIFHD